VAEDDRLSLVYNRILQPTDLAHPGIATTMHLVQEWVPKHHDVRVTVVGGQVFAVAIHAGSPAAMVDFRADYAALEYECVDVP